ncbi:MAG: SEC-C metal-binding domain-containing protein [Sandaracinaceae bacterium]
MAKVGRNDPCPCGSGKKHKRCCGAGGVTPLGRKSHWHDVDERLVRKALRWVEKTFPDEPPPMEDFPYELGPDSEPHVPLLVSWALHVRPMRDGGLPIASRYLEAQGRKLDARERQWLEANRHAFFSIHEVLESRPGISVTLRCRFTERETVVHEVSASEALRLGHHILAHVVEIDGVGLLNGLHPRPMSAMQGQELYELARRALHETLGMRPRARLKPAEMCDPRVAFALLHTWEASFRQRRPPELRNTDGDPLLFVRERYSFDPEQRAALLRALAELPGAVEAGKDDGETVLNLTRPGNAMHRGWDNTTMAVFRLGAAELVVETNSEKRADAAGAALGPLLDHLRFVERDARPVDELPQPDPSGSGLPEGVDREEVAAILREMKERHYADWCSQPLPALDGKTPLEAVQGKRTRQRVQALLADMERHESGAPPDERFDVGRLRRELGLESTRG